MLKLSPSGSFGVEVCLYDYGVEENPPANFGKRQRSGFLLVPQPAKARAAGFVEKDFEQLGRVNVARRQRVLFLGLRC